MTTRTPDYHRAESLARVFLDARDVVFSAGYADEIDLQHEICFEKMSESDFLREAAWVILSSGMKETVVRAKFPEISRAFLGWRSAKEIVARKRECRASALCSFANVRKIESIVGVAECITELSFDTVRDRIAAEDVTFLETLPFIGPVTSYHLAKNIGIDVVKPDRHLLRITSAAGYESPDELCRTIAELTGEKLCVIDLVLWRFATIDSKYMDRVARSFDASPSPGFLGSTCDLDLAMRLTG